MIVVTTVGSCYTEEEISFDISIRPILKNKCMSCHGGVRQQGGLSFLFEEEMYQKLKSGKITIVKGNAHKSEMYNRITSQDPDKIMPPKGEKLNPTEIALIEKWINQGAKWEEHWAFIPPTEKDIPHSDTSWIKNEIDQFVFRTLKEHQLSPSTRAAPEELLRRIYLDIIGIPPNLEDLDDFLKDPSDENLERIVDHLLASMHFGEKWASFWLDLARYADSQGFQKDHLRPTAWIYRDWVIQALNDDMPIDSFTIRQLAGDLLANATDQDYIATGFHRNTMTNDEGGTDDEEYRVRAVMDRVNTTMEVWQGSTFGCVQCHSHPYDPIKHEEYYALKGYFNNTADHDLTSDFPKMSLLSQAQYNRKNALALKLNNDEKLTKTERKEIIKMIESIAPKPVMVMQDLSADSSRINPLFVRGNWTAQEGDITPDVPKSFDQSHKSYAPNRLGLANWIVDADNPLTGRVMVNRFWEQIFGRGIVKTVEDIGIQSDDPSHPELLDWLALQFIRNKEWRLKPLLKMIVMSATYQQDSKISKEKLNKDPSNKLLSRGPRFRLTAEQIRDQALAVSDLLNPEVYGSSEMPYQPEGVWNVIREVARWKQSENNAAHRRGIYTFYRRVSPYPTMLLFDAPSRELCISRRIRTNTPLQALVTMNDPVFTECIAKLASNAQNHYPNELSKQIRWAYRKATGKTITEERLSILEKLYQDNNRNLKSVCTAIMNLDEFLMKR